MRLLNIYSLEFAVFREVDRPKYVIASHRWVEGDEVTLQDVVSKQNTHKSGFQKIVDFASYVRRQVSSVEWLWVDTCCIDKTNNAELSKSLNLMFDWYRDAVLCIAYFADVEDAADMGAFARSDWFKRGWTLQELLAPRLVVFATTTWHVIGNRGASTYLDCGTPVGPSLEEEIATITSIPEKVLRDYVSSSTYSVDEKLKWMEGRVTTEPEDMSYALFGILGVTPGANYGEKHGGARQRLLDAVTSKENKRTQQVERFQNIVAWLSPPDPWTNHHTALQLHQSDTGSWLLQSATYQDWKGHSTSPLWLYGKAGCGKTVLCSTAIEDVKAYCEDRPDVTYAIFYFSFSDDMKQRIPDLLRSLVAQLGWKDPALSMLQQAFDKPNRSLLGVFELESILLSCLEAHSEVFLLIDALDECPEDNDGRRSVVDCLVRLLKQAQNVKICVTSRELSDIRTSMEGMGATTQAIDSHTVDEDIRQYTSTTLLCDNRLSRLDQKTKALIEETISQKANGMFRWAYCQLRELKKLKATKPKYVKDLLHNLPTTLDATYERMLGNIDKMYRTEALALLQWLAYAQRPLSLGELLEATIIDLDGEGSVMEDERGAIEDALEILSGLVVLQDADTGEDGEYSEAFQENSESTQEHNLGRRIGRDTKLRLAHFSVKEYLESRRILQSEVPMFYLESTVGHRFLAQSSLVYLMHYSCNSTQSSTYGDLEAFPLLGYAASSWFVHSGRQNSEDVSREVSLLNSPDTLRNWLLVFRPDRNWERSFEPLDGIGSSLYYASFTGLQSVLSGLLACGADPNQQEGEYGTAIYIASLEGHLDFVHLLLNGGADVNKQGGPHGNALQAASLGGHLEIVHLLLNKGADVNKQGGYYGNALQAASSHGHLEIVQLLLNEGATVNKLAGTYRTALQAACSGGSLEIVQLLLNRDADMNDCGGYYGSALQVASFTGHLEIVQLLVDNAVDVDKQGAHAENALQAACRGGHLEIVYLLLEAGAETNAHGGRWGNALQIAVCGNKKEMVQMLLEARADVNACGNSSTGYVLTEASCRGHKELVQMLLGAGADVNAQGEPYGSALQAASYRGYKEVARMLIEAGAVVDAQGGRHGSALCAASLEGHEEVVQMLLGAGADINAQNQAYGNALQAASYRGRKDIVKILLEAGSDIDARGVSNAWYRSLTELELAVREGHGEIVELLLEAGAEVNYDDALQAAEQAGHQEVVKVLVKARANVDARNERSGGEQVESR